MTHTRFAHIPHPRRAALSLALGLSAGIALLAVPASAGPPDMAEVSVLKGWSLSNGKHIAAIRITLEDGWHTYWRAPGDAGIPPRFEWSGSQNVADIKVHWPVPGVYEQNDMRYVGYEGEVVLPVEITPKTAGDITLSGRIDFGVCDDVCIPKSETIDVVIDRNGAKAAYPMIARALRDMPKKISGARCAAEPISDGMKLAATVDVPKLGAHEVVVIEHPDRSVWVSEAMTSRNGGALTATSEMVPATAQPFMIDRSQLVITVIGDGVAYEAKGCTSG